MLLTKLISALDKYAQPHVIYHSDKFNQNNLDVTSIVDDSRMAVRGSCFIAIKGINVDGHDFIKTAVKCGAAVVVGEKDIPKNKRRNFIYIKVNNSRKALSYMASAWYQYPAEEMKIIGVTGTKGKTTSAFVLYQLLKKAGYKVGVVTSAGIYYLNTVDDTGLHVTNPQPLIMQKILSDMLSVGIEYVILEVTSHGLDQYRVEGIKFNCAVLTNIAPEHLDYHKTLMKYVNTKLKLFKNSKTNILNKDDDFYNYISSKLEDKSIVTYSLKKPADYRLKIKGLQNKPELFLQKKRKNIKIASNLAGVFNFYNMISAVAVAEKLGVPLTQIVKLIKDIKLPKGRQEEIINSLGLKVVIDFAHTPESLRSILEYYKSIKKGKLIVVFGCAGERDRLKRPIMGKIASKLSDVAILTAEDPRIEDVNDIISQIEEGFPCRSKDKKKSLVKLNYYKIPDRGEAVFYAINSVAKIGDTVVICGKGNEKSMCYGKTEYPWSDYEAVMCALDGKVLKINYG